MNIGRLTVPQRISAASMLAVVLGAFLPWVSILGVSVIGVEGDGVLTLLAAVAGLVILTVTTGLVGAERVPGRVSEVALLVLAGLTALIGLVDMSGAAAGGLYLTLLGGIAWVVGAGWQLGVSKQDATAAPAAHDDRL